MTHIKAAIDELRAERDAAVKRAKELEEGLRPFAEYAAVLDNSCGDEMMVGYYYPPRLTVGDCRRAAALLAANGGPASGEPTGGER